ncbi:PH domain-containing protein [Actinotalea sp. C106]|uniref:PH domain-containing protein n=1 Tax=Actinotalea sp. C106 TaxID=2908644 RepID=UPI00202779F8|nr:PH domain-containing protein [Actinotalea sp. C106]
MTDRPAPQGPPGLHRPFRPRLARVVSLGLAVLVAVTSIGLVLGLPSVAPSWDTPASRVSILAFGALIVWFLARQAGVAAHPDETGLTVRNLAVSRHVTWAEIVSVRFGHGRPWVQLDLADGDVLPVMAVQSADGALAAAEAQRMATLVAYHSRTARDD